MCVCVFGASECVCRNKNKRIVPRILSCYVVDLILFVDVRSPTPRHVQCPFIPPIRFVCILNTHLIFSSGNPRVSNTKPHSNSLKAIPFCVPPQAVYNQSANTVGTPSFISCTKTVLLSSVPFVPVERLNASLMRRNSLSVTVIRK